MRNAWSFCSKVLKRETPSLNAESRFMDSQSSHRMVKHTRTLSVPIKVPSFTVQGHPGSCGVYQDKQ